MVEPAYEDIEFVNEMREIYLSECNEKIDFVSTQLIKLEKDPANAEIINGTFRAVHSMKGNAANYGFPIASRVAQKMEDVLDRIRKGSLTVTSDVVDVLLRFLDLLELIFNDAKQGVTDLVRYETILRELSRSPYMKKNIAVIEKSSLIMDVVEMLARLLDTNIRTFTTPQDALNALHKDIYDLVITSIEFDGLSGLEFIERIRKNESFKEKPIIIITAKSPQDFASSEKNEYTVIRKDTNFERSLMTTVRDILKT